MKMKMVKKLVAMALVSTMTLSGLAACGDTKEEKPAKEETGKEEGKETEEGKQTLKLAAFKGGNGEKIWEDIAAAFEEEKGVEVELEMSSELDKDLTKSIQKGEFPDVVYYNLGQKSGFTETMLKEGAVADISDVFADEELKSRLLDGITDGTDAQPFADGKIYLAPIFYTPTGFWYNKNLFEGENKKYDLPTTWEEFFALGDAAKADGVALFTFPQSGYLDTTMYSMLAQAGGTEFYQKAIKYDKDTWTSEPGKKVLDTLGKLVSADYTEKDTVANANADGGFKINQQNVIDNKALFMPNGNWVIGEMAASTPEEFRWGMMPAPKWDGDESQTMYTFTEQMWIPAEAENMDLAKEFIKFMYSDKVVDILLNNETTDKETGTTAPAPVVAPVKGAAEKLPEGTTKDCYEASTADNIVTVTGGWVATEPIEGLNMKEAVYGPAYGVNTGEMTVEDWQAQLTETWEKCAGALK